MWPFCFNAIGTPECGTTDPLEDEVTGRAGTCDAATNVSTGVCEADAGADNATSVAFNGGCRADAAEMFFRPRRRSAAVSCTPLVDEVVLLSLLVAAVVFDGGVAGEVGRRRLSVSATAEDGTYALALGFIASDYIVGTTVKKKKKEQPGSVRQKMYQTSTKRNYNISSKDGKKSGVYFCICV